MMSVKLWRVALVVALTVLVGGCFGSDKKLGLRGDAGGGQETRSFEMIRVLDHSVNPPKMKEVTIDLLNSAASGACDDDCQGITNTCELHLCMLAAHHCGAKTLLAASKPQATLPRVGNYTI